MKTREFFNAYWPLVVFIVVVVVLSSNCGNNGIVTLEGYGEAVAFCGNEYHSVVHSVEAHVWTDDMATYVVNEGHKDDSEVNKLVKLAHVECAKYMD